MLNMWPMLYTYADKRTFWGTDNGTFLNGMKVLKFKKLVTTGFSWVPRDIMDSSEKFLDRKSNTGLHVSSGSTYIT